MLLVGLRDMLRRDALGKGCLMGMVSGVLGDCF